MKTLEDFKNSAAWDPRYELPTVPMHNNPHLYTAYSIKVVCDADQTSFKENDKFMDDYAKYLVKCMVLPGLFNRWPAGFGGQTSHDEVAGIAYLNAEAARQLLDYLLVHDGDYQNTDTPPKVPEEDNHFRFFWMEPFLKACAGYRVSLLSQLYWITCLVSDFWTKKEALNYGSILLTWLMIEKMDKYWLSGLFIYFWKKRMKSLGVGPKYIFQNKYLSEVPIFGQNALDNF